MVDDRPENLMALQAILSGPSYRLVAARSGDEALSKMLKDEFALILLDVMMPGMDGYELASLIRSRASTRETPIIFMTAVAKEIDHVSKGYSVGAVDYLTKPLEADLVRAKVAVFADLYRKSQRIVEQEKALREREAKEKEKELARTRQEGAAQFKMLADAMPLLVWIADPELRLKLVNRNWIDFTGLGDSATAGHLLHDIVHPNDQKATAAAWSNAIESGRRDFEVEHRLRGRAGDYRWFLTRAMRSASEDGTESWYGTSTEIHDQKRVQEELRKAREMADSANQMKSVFLATMSHEIRTPLNAILGFTDLMRDSGVANDEKESHLRVIARNGENLVHLINDILDLSKVESGHMEIEHIEFAVHELAEEVVSLLKQKAEDKKVKLELVIEADVPTRFVSDPVRAKQILVNLVDNAIKFTPKGTVRLLVSGEGENLRFLVKDEGIGISDEQQQKIFRPFTQADGSMTRKFGGTGLGLVLSRKLARLLGGDVTLRESLPGQGSLFEARIRKAAPEFSQVSKRARRAFADPSILPGAPAGALTGKRVLVVEDAPDNQNFIAHVLKKRGIVVEIANNGAEGVEKALSSDYDVVLMDIQMPVLDGYSATARLRETGYQKPIIALTAHALPEYRKKCLYSGCDDYLAKPVTREELVNVIAKYATRPVEAEA